MTIFYISENEICSKIANSFDFFEPANLESIKNVLNEMNPTYSDDKIGFVVTSSGNNFEKCVYELFEKIVFNSDYFFAIIIKEKNASDSPRKFFELCKKYNINLKYLNFVSENDSKTKILDKGIAFRSEVGLLVTKIKGIEMKNKFLGIVETFLSSFENAKSQTQPIN